MKPEENKKAFEDLGAAVAALETALKEAYKTFPDRGAGVPRIRSK